MDSAIVWFGCIFPKTSNLAGTPVPNYQYKYATYTGKNACIFRVLLFARKSSTAMNYKIK
jgi:hypothetical protein